MATALVEMKGHRHAVAACQADTAWLEGALHDASKLVVFLGEINDLVVDGVSAFEEFDAWAHGIEANWSRDPKQFDPIVMTSIDELRSRWSVTIRRIASIAEWAAARDAAPSRIQQLLAIATKLAAIERMDRGPMPDHMLKLSAEAAEGVERGDDEVIGPDRL